MRQVCRTKSSGIARSLRFFFYMRTKTSVKDLSVLHPRVILLCGHPQESFIFEPSDRKLLEFQLKVNDEINQLTFLEFVTLGEFSVSLALAGCGLCEAKMAANSNQKSRRPKGLRRAPLTRDLLNLALLLAFFHVDPDSYLGKKLN